MKAEGMIFIITEEHLKLLQRLIICQDENSFAIPSPYVSDKRPYGNSDYLDDIAEILGWKINPCGLTEKQEKKAIKLHKELGIALQICLMNKEFITGIFINNDDCHFQTEWKKLEEQNDNNKKI